MTGELVRRFSMWYKITEHGRLSVFLENIFTLLKIKAFVFEW